MKKNVVLIFAFFLISFNNYAQWTKQINDKYFFFNSVSFIDKDYGWVLGNGTDNSKPPPNEVHLFTTKNGGNLWTEVSVPEINLKWYNCIQLIDKQKGWIVGDSGLVFQSIDFGESWIPVNLGTSSKLIQVKFACNDSGFIVSNERNIWFTSNAGMIWNNLQNLPSITLMGIDYKNGTTFIFGNNGIGGLIYKSTDLINWVKIYDNIIPIYSICFVDSEIGYAVGVNCEIMKTNDGGENWIHQELNDSYTLNKVYFINEMNGWAIGDTKINFTNDGGEHWIRSKLNAEGLLEDVQFIDSNTGWICGSSGSVYGTSNGADTFYINFYTKEQNIDLGTQVKFINLSKGKYNSFTWDFGDNTTSNEFEPTHNYKDTGIYTVSLRGEAMYNYSWRKKNYITVNDPSPVKADFSVNINSGESPLTVNFINNSTGYILDYYWDFGDGGFSIEKNPVYTYYYPGTYTVKLVVKRKNKADSLIKNSLINIENYQSSWYPQKTNMGTKSINKIQMIDRNNGWAVSDSGYVLQTIDGGRNWISKQLPDLDNYPVKGLFFLNKNVGFIGSQYGRLIKTTNGGISWNKIVLGDIKIEKIFFENDNTGYMIINDFSSYSFYKSTDGGISWFNTQLVTGNFFEDFAITNKEIIISSGSNLNVFNKESNELIRSYNNCWFNSISVIDTITWICVGDYGKISRTTNKGITWNNIIPARTGHFKNIKFLDSKHGYICGDVGIILYTSDAGLTWKKQFATINPNLLNLSIVDSNYAWTAGANGAILTTIDGGRDTIFADFDYTTHYKWDPQLTEFNNKSILANNYTWYFDDGDSSNQKNPSHLFKKNGTYNVSLKVTNGRRFDITSKEIMVQYFFEGWNIFTPVKINGTVYDINFLNDTTGYLAIYDYFSAKTSNGGHNWFYPQISYPHKDSLKNLKKLKYFTEKQGLGIQLYNDTYIKTSDGGNSWSKHSLLSENPDLVSGWVNQSLQTTDTSEAWICCGDQSKILHSTNYGNSWEVVKTNIPNSGLSNLFFSDKYHGFALSINGNISATKDAGKTWELIYSTDYVPNNEYTLIFFSDSLHGWMSYRNNSTSIIFDFLRTTDGGFTWNSIDYPGKTDTYQPYHFAFSDSLNGLCGVYDWYKKTYSLLYTKDGGITWNILNGIKTIIGNSMDISLIDYNKYNGWWVFYNSENKNLFCHLTSNDFEKINAIPFSKENIFPPYPNPFREMTNIEFEINTPQFVEGILYNELGAEVNNFYKGYLNIGKHSLQINATNLQNGIYFFKITGKELFFNGKIIILK